MVLIFQSGFLLSYQFHGRILGGGGSLFCSSATYVEARPVINEGSRTSHFNSALVS